MEKEKGENISWKKYGEGTGAKYLEKELSLPSCQKHYRWHNSLNTKIPKLEMLFIISIGE